MVARHLLLAVLTLAVVVVVLVLLVYPALVRLAEMGGRLLLIQFLDRLFHTLLVAVVVPVEERVALVEQTLAMEPAITPPEEVQQPIAVVAVAVVDMRPVLAVPAALAVPASSSFARSPASAVQARPLRVARSRRTRVTARMAC